MPLPGWHLCPWALPSRLSFSLPHLISPRRLAASAVSAPATLVKMPGLFSFVQQDSVTLPITHVLPVQSCVWGYPLAPAVLSSQRVWDMCRECWWGSLEAWIVVGLAVRLWASHFSLGLCFLAWDRVVMKPAPQG